MYTNPAEGARKPGREYTLGRADEQQEGAVVGDAAEIAGAGVGPQGLVAGVDVVVGGQEGRVQDGERTGGRQAGGNEGLVDELPASFEADGSGTPATQRLRQVDQSCHLGPLKKTVLLSVPERALPSVPGRVLPKVPGWIKRLGQKAEDRTVRGVVEVADGEDALLPGGMQGVRNGPEPSGGGLPAPIGVAATIFGREMAHQDGPSPPACILQLGQQDISGKESVQQIGGRLGRNLRRFLRTLFRCRRPDGKGRGMDQGKGCGPVEQSHIDAPPVRRLEMDKGIVQFPKHGPVDQTAQDKGVFHFLDGDDVRQASRLFPCPNHGFPNGPGFRFKLLPGPVPASPGTEFRIRFAGAAI